MAQVLIFLAEGHEEVEMLTVVDLLRRAKIEVEMVSITGNRMVTGSHGVTLQADVCIEDADFTRAQMLVLPGGMPGTNHLKAHEMLCTRVKEFAQTGKWLAAVCAAPSVLGAWGILEDKSATCYPGFEEALHCKEFVEAPVVTDKNCITSRGMGTSIAFGLEIIRVLVSERESQRIKEAILYEM